MPGPIWETMGSDYSSDILGELLFSRDACARGTSGRLGTFSGRTTSLDTSVHVRLVVEADEQELMASLNGPGERLEPDIVCASVTCEGYEPDILGNLAFPLEDRVGRFNTADRSGGVLEGTVDPWNVPSGERISRCRDLKQPVAFDTTTGLSVAIRTCRAMVGSEQPGQSRWPSVNLSGLSLSSLMDIIASPPRSSGSSHFQTSFELSPVLALRCRCPFLQARKYSCMP